MTARDTITHRVRAVPSLDDLLAELDDRRPFSHSDSLSGSSFERVRYRGERMIVKYVSADDDWIMRATGDIDSRMLRLFRSDVMERLPDSIDHATVAIAPFVSPRGFRGAALLMRDVSEAMVPPGGELIDPDTHARFIEHMAELHATFWGWTDRFELMPLTHHYSILTPTTAALEGLRNGHDPVPPAVDAGWMELRRTWPRLAATLGDVARDPGPLAAALQATPQTFIHADWKLGNLGEHADGRTVLLDWDRSGAAPATFDLSWYLAVNCDRIPVTKEATIDSYRQHLESRGVATDGWWEQQLALTLLGAGLMLAWAKVHDPAELGWWAERIFEGASRLP